MLLASKPVSKSKKLLPAEWNGAINQVLAIARFSSHFVFASPLPPTDMIVIEGVVR
jgi:hypothetical protein